MENDEKKYFVEWISCWYAWSPDTFEIDEIKDNEFEYKHERSSTEYGRDALYTIHVIANEREYRILKEYKDILATVRDDVVTKEAFNMLQGMYRSRHPRKEIGENE